MKAPVKFFNLPLLVPARTFRYDRPSSAKPVRGSGCVPVGALVFKISGRSRRASGGGFDSHPLPSFLISVLPAMHPTPYSEINALLAQFLAELQVVLSAQLAGLYLHGSLAGGDFNPHRSDIDFLVATQGPLDDAQVAELASLHKRFSAAGSRWAAELDGSYFPLAALRRYDPADACYPHVESHGALGVEQHESDWILQMHVLRERGLALAGPAPDTLIDPVSPDDLRRASRDILHVWWLPQLDDTYRLQESGYQTYAILTMCRILYTVTQGAVVSKTVAARWLQEQAPPWAPLVAAALQWRNGLPLAHLEETLAFIRFTRDRCP